MTFLHMRTHQQLDASLHIWRTAAHRARNAAVDPDSSGDGTLISLASQPTVFESIQSIYVLCCNPSGNNTDTGDRTVRLLSNTRRPPVVVVVSSLRNRITTSAAAESKFVSIAP